MSSLATLDTRRMALHRKRKIVAGHACAVIGNADTPPSAAIGKNIDTSGACVDGVFHKFLHGACGPLDDFASSDAVDDLFGQLSDGHGIPANRVSWHSKPPGGQGTTEEEFCPLITPQR